MTRDQLQREYDEVKAQGLNLNMARGKPGADQLALSHALLGPLDTAIAEDGTDCCNYGVLDGIPEAKRLMAILLDDEAENVFVGGNASLTLMYDTIARYHTFGTLGHTPWSKLAQVKWLCPVPGYDRHFAITQAFGYEMIPLPLAEDGPDMDEVEKLVADPSVKGIWCVPKYSNPSGTTYSEKTVKRLAAMECAAPDFRIIWDNAYCIHHLYDGASQQDQLLDIGRACIEAGNADRYVKFASTSKVTLPGAGISAFAASPANMAEAKSRIGVQAIGADKLNQLRHARFLPDGDALASHMKKHAAILRPKFELVQAKLAEGLANMDDCSWTNPRGGYFVSLDVPQGCAKEVVRLAREAGVMLTEAGATWPLGADPDDRNIRIAPTLPPLEELAHALDVLVLCVKLAHSRMLAG